MTLLEMIETAKLGGVIKLGRFYGHESYLSGVDWLDADSLLAK